MNQPTITATWLSFSLAIAASGCGQNSGSNERNDVEAGDAGAIPVKALEIASRAGCAVDADCAAVSFCFQGVCAAECEADKDCADDDVCSDRGRCLPSDAVESESETRDDYEPKVSVRSTTDTVISVAVEDTTAVFSLQLDKAAPEQGIAYTIERDDEEAGIQRVYRAFGKPGEKRVNVEIPLGQADPALGAKSRQVNLKLATSVGAFSLALQPPAPVTGTYAGSARVGVFGGTGLPMSFQIVTRPNHVALEDAEEAWLVLPAATDNLFSPIEAFDGAPNAVVMPLVYDDFVERWVATTRNEYRLPEGALIAAEAGEVLRALRFEVEPLEGNRIVGSFSDRWEGLYDARSAQGVMDQVDVVFEGELDLERVAPAPGYKSLPAPLELQLPSGRQPSAPSIAQCDQAAFFPAEATALAGAEYDCDAIASGGQFKKASPQAQAACALSSAGVALQGETTGAALTAFLDESVDNPNGQSFSDFMEACADGTDGTCVPSEEVLCARQLLAHAFYNQEDDSDAARQLVVTYQTITNEAFLGRQLAAFQRDTDTRLSWLKTSDYPAIVTSAVKDLITRLLDEWQADVLDAHLGVLQGYFDPSGLGVMSRETSGDALDARRRLLAQIVQGWRGAMDALVMATDRWQELYQDEAQRADKASYVRSKMLDLYLTAGVLRNLTRGAGSGYQATAFGAGFSELMRSVGKLNLSFDNLVFARDAEVAVSTSLDPNSDNDSLLGELRTDAELEIESAAEAVQTVLSEAESEALNEAQLQDRMGNEINAVRDELVELCGLPVGCSAKDFRSEAECQVRVAAGECGFLLERGTDDYLAFGVGEQSVSEAGRALLAMTDAAQGVGIAAEEARAHESKLSLELATMGALAATVQDWNQERLAGLQALVELLDDQGVWLAKGLGELNDAWQDKVAVRSAQMERMEGNLETWDGMRVADANTNFALQTAATVARTAADTLRNVAETTKDFAEAAADGLPKSVGTSNDVSAPARLAIRLGSAGAVAGMRIAAAGVDVAAAGLEIALDKTRSLQEAKLVKLQEEAELADAISDNELAELEEVLAVNSETNEIEIGNLQGAYDIAKLQRDAELAYSRDLVELRRRRTLYLQMLEEHAGLLLRVERAKLGLESRQGEYLAVVQRGELLDAKLGDLSAQRADVNQLVGSPGAVFARANRLSQAENRLQRAKAKLMDWLVALEYFAVRPFIDQRLQILLARNTYQLEDIADEMARLERRCGGAVNEDSATLSVRDELLGLTLTTEDPVASEESAPTERFRSLLNEGYVPIDKRVRYRTDSTVGDLLQQEGGLLAATFDVDLDNFANLAATCNAKVLSVAVQLVGDVGQARPTVTLLYDGTSQLRSCQAGIRDTVDLIGRDRTAFDEITRLRVPGRSISPVASINEWKADEASTGNLSLGGLPLASQYTVLIDTELGENAKLDWSQLDDILLDVRYDYSDVFAAGQCE